MPDYDSHSKMLEELGIEDNYINASKVFVRAELSPEEEDAFSNIDSWKLTVDQDIIPAWFDRAECTERMRTAVKEWAKTHIFIGQDCLNISHGENIFIKNCRNVNIYGDAKVELICGESIVKEIYDKAKIHAICGNTAINRIGDAATVEYIYENTTVAYISGNATVRSICGNAIIECIYNNARVNSIYDDAEVREISGEATIISSQYIKWNKSNLLIITGNALFKDCYTKTIHHSGNWKLVKSKK